MNKLENAIIDVYDDVNLSNTLVKIAGEIPKEMRGVDLPTIEERNSLDDTSFALSIITKQASKLNKYPINSKINTVLSNEYFDLNHGKLPAEAQKVAATYIKMACDRYGVAPKHSVKLASEQFPIMTNIYIEKEKDIPAGSLIVKEAESPNSEYYYALTKTAGDGVTNRAYAMPNGEFVKKAESYFENYYKQFSPEDRNQYATNVVKRALELGVEVTSPAITKYAGLNYNESLKDYLGIRRKLLDDKPEFSEALDKLASYQDKTDPQTFAKVLHELDKKAGLDKYYDRYLADPYLTTFAPMAKTANFIYESEGLSLSEGDIQKVANDSYDTLKTYFGVTLADGLKKEGTAAFVALPDDAKEVIARIANGEIQ